MLIVQTIILPLLFLAPLGVAKLRRQGWLDRLVAYHKKNFIEDLARLPLPITVSVEKAPAGYVDHPGWDFESVLRLVLLIEVVGAEPARRAVRYAMAPTRRHYLPFGVDTYQLFPSWSEFSVVNENDDTMNLTGVDEKYGPQPFDNDTVVYIDNPLEASMPSARITIKKMREVMEAEALERRNMATTTITVPKYSFTHKQSTEKAPAENATGPAEPSGNTTQEEAGSANATDDSATADPSGVATDAAASEAAEPNAASEAGVPAASAEPGDPAATAEPAGTAEPPTAEPEA